MSRVFQKEKPTKKSTLSFSGDNFARVRAVPRCDQRDNAGAAGNPAARPRTAHDFSFMSNRAAGEDGGSDAERENFRFIVVPSRNGPQNAVGGPLRELDENEPRKSPGS